MIEIVFDLNQVITKIQGNIKEPFKNVIKRYIQKSNYKRDELRLPSKLVQLPMLH